MIFKFSLNLLNRKLILLNQKRIVKRNRKVVSKKEWVNVSRNGNWKRRKEPFRIF